MAYFLENVFSIFSFLFCAFLSVFLHWRAGQNFDNKINDIISNLKEKKSPRLVFTGEQIKSFEKALYYLVSLDKKKYGIDVAIKQLSSGSADEAKSILKDVGLANEDIDVEKAIESYISLGSIAFFENIDDSIFAYEKAIQFRPDDFETCIRLAEQYFRKDKHDLAWGIYDTILQKVDENSKLRAVALNGLGGIEFSKAEYAKALSYYYKALKINNRVKNYNGLAANYNNVALLCQYMDKFEKAIKYHRKVVDLGDKVTEVSIIANSYMNVGVVYKRQDSYIEAIQSYKEAYKIYERLKYYHGVANVLGNLGNIFRLQGNVEEAIYNHRKSLKINKKFKFKTDMAKNYTNIGLCFFIENKFKKAAEYFSISKPIFKELGDKRGVASTLNNLGDCSFELGDMPEAINYYSKALKINESISRISKILSGHRKLGEAYRKFDNFPDSISVYSKLIMLSEEYAGVLKNDYYELSKLYYDTDKYTLAEINVRSFLRMSEEEGDVIAMNRASELLTLIKSKSN